MFIGEVLSVFCFLWWPWPLYSSWLFVGLYPFGNKFLIIQKKRGYVPMSTRVTLSKSMCQKTQDERTNMSMTPYASDIGSIMYTM